MKNEKVNPIEYAPLSQIEKPMNMLREPGDKFCARITENGTEVATLHTSDGVKRSMVRYKSGRTVQTISQ